MKKMLSYLKKYWKSILIVIVLLFTQAICDLSLPNYMSDIINVGLQQSGITSSAPEVISEKGMRLMTLFMTEEEQELVKESYELIEMGNKDYMDSYPLIETSNLYKMKEKDKKLEDAFSNATVAMISYMQAQKTDTETTTNMADFTQIYQMLPILESMPKETFEPFIDGASDNHNSLLNQSGITMVKFLYQEVGMNTDNLQQEYIIKTGFKMIGLALLIALTAIGVGYFSSKIGTGFSRDLRFDVFKKVESFSTVEMKQFGVPSLITRTTNDIQQIQMLIIMALRMMCYAPIMGIGGIIMALGKSVSMSWIIALAVVVLIGLIMVIFAIAMPKFQKMQTLIDKLNLVARENLSGILVIRAFGTQKFEEERFDKANTDLAKTNLFVNRVMIFMMPAMTFIMNGVVALIVWVGAHQIETSAMQVGDMMAFMQYGMQIIMSFLMISMMFIMVPRAGVSIRRVNEILDTTPSILEPKEPKKFDKKQMGVVEFKNVNFRYADAEEDVLHHISFKAMPGKTTAFIGSTGSGKSTLINLIPRFFDVTGGKIFVNGIDVRDASLKDLRESIGYIPQKGVLLSGTIDSNLRYGKEKATKKEIEEAATIAQAMEFIDAKEDKFESEISQGGTNVSGGQKQRLSIARALVKKPAIYIFDDSFSALDFKTDAALRTALKPYTKNSTVLIVAQRISTIMNADQIIVLDQGEIVGMGTHEELLKNCPTYLEIAESQLGKEELS